MSILQPSLNSSISKFFTEAYFSSFLNNRIHQKRKGRRSTLNDIERDQDIIFINNQSLKDFFHHLPELNDSHLNQLYDRLLPNADQNARDYLAASLNQHGLLFPLSRMLNEILNSRDNNSSDGYFISLPSEQYESKMEFTSEEGCLLIKETIKIQGYRLMKGKEELKNIQAKQNENLYEAEASYKLSFSHPEGPKLLQLKFLDSIKDIQPEETLISEDKQPEETLTSSIRKDLKNKIKEFLQSLCKPKESCTELALEAENLTERENPYQSQEVLNKKIEIINVSDQETTQVSNRNRYRA